MKIKMEVMHESSRPQILNRIEIIIVWFSYQIMQPYFGSREKDKINMDIKQYKDYPMATHWLARLHTDYTPDLC